MSLLGTFPLFCGARGRHISGYLGVVLTSFTFSPPDVPNSPANLMLTPSGTDLTLSWSSPTNVPPGVPVTYCVNITGTGVNNRYICIQVLVVHVDVYVQSWIDR